MNRRQSSILVILLLMAALGVGLLIDPSNTSEETTTATTPLVNPTYPFLGPNDVTLVYPVDTDRLNDILSNVVSGWPPPDGIPPIENPEFITAEQAMEGFFLHNNSIVFGLYFDGIAIAFPQLILVWHEIVNFEINGKPISATYCPLTSSGIGFHGWLGDGKNTTFGTSGRLVNSNLVMYDRRTFSYWPQILSQGLDGQSIGVGLQRIQMYFTTWEAWMMVHPDTLVLSENTGFIRNYKNDPYGSYYDINTYYHTGGPAFPVMNEDDRLPHKEMVVGIDVNGSQIAIRKSDMRDWQVYNFKFGESKYVVLYDNDLNVARSYLSMLNGQELTFRLVDGEIIDDETQNVWSHYGTSNLGTLPVVANMDVFWFAWTAFFPDTELVCNECP